MSRSAKPLSINNSHLTKEEIELRQEQEEKLKGNNDLVFISPKDLKTKEEKELYLFLVQEMKASNILNNLDIQMLVQTVDSIIKMKEANKLIKKHGMLIKKVDGSLQKNPAINIYKEYNQIFYQCCLQLGLSPSARAKLSVINIDTTNKNNDPVLKALHGDKV